MKIYNRYIIIIVLLTITSCKKEFLNVVETGSLTRQGYVIDLNTTEQFLEGIYVMLYGELYEHGIAAAYPDLAADNLMPLASTSTQSMAAQYSWSQLAGDEAPFKPIESSNNMNGNWLGGYHIIRACNFVIEKTIQFQNEDLRKSSRIRAQAYAIRALVHFKLVNIFAQSYKFTSDANHPGIPYIKTSDISAAYTRHTVNEVYTYMIDDLKEAISLFQDQSVDIRYMNSMASKALLARIYLFKEDYLNARDLAIEVADKFPLMKISEGYPNGIFRNRQSAATEAIFQLVPCNIGTPNASRFLGMYLRGSSMLYRATKDISSILKEDNNDIRSTWVTNVSGQWNVTKFPTNVAATEVPAITIAETAYYPAVIRSTEVHLIVSESSAMLNDQSVALKYLNDVRRRANPTIALVNASGTALMDSIYKERRKEFCFEGFRMYDLQRWKLGVRRTEVHPSYGTASNLPFPSDKAISPIPINDVQIGGIPQNKGY